MKKQFRSLLVVVALVSMLISACGGAATAETSAGGDKPHAALVEFTGVIEAIEGNQWTINGQVITVDPIILRDGPFVVGDTVKVEAEVQADGTVVVTRVEPPLAGADDNSNDDNSNSSLDNVNSNSNDNTNSSVVTNSNDNSSIGSNSNDDNSNDDNGNDNNSNDDNSNGDNSNDDNSNNDNSDDDNGNDDDNSGSDDDDDDDSNENG